MPAQYVAIRDKLAKTMSYDEAQKHAAMIYNSKHHNNPMSPAHPEGMLSSLKKYVPRKK